MANRLYLQTDHDLFHPLFFPSRLVNLSTTTTTTTTTRGHSVMFLRFRLAVRAFWENIQLSRLERFRTYLANSWLSHLESV